MTWLGERSRALGPGTAPSSVLVVVVVVAASCLAALLALGCEEPAGPGMHAGVDARVVDARPRPDVPPFPGARIVNARPLEAGELPDPIQRHFCDQPP